MYDALSLGHLYCVAATKFYRGNNDFHTMRIVAATCPRDVSQRLIASGVPALMEAGELRQEPVRASPESVTSRFCYHFLIIASSLAAKYDVTVLAPVVQTMDSAVHRINHYPADKH